MPNNNGSCTVTQHERPERLQRVFGSVVTTTENITHSNHSDSHTKYVYVWTTDRSVGIFVAIHIGTGFLLTDFTMGLYKHTHLIIQTSRYQLLFSPLSSSSYRHSSRHLLYVHLACLHFSDWFSSSDATAQCGPGPPHSWGFWITHKMADHIR